MNNFFSLLATFVLISNIYSQSDTLYLDYLKIPCTINRATSDSIYYFSSIMNKNFAIKSSLLYTVYFEGEKQIMPIEEDLNLLDVATPYEYSKVKTVKYLDYNLLKEIDEFEILVSASTVSKVNYNSLLIVKMLCAIMGGNLAYIEYLQTPQPPLLTIFPMLRPDTIPENPTAKIYAKVMSDKLPDIHKFKHLIKSQTNFLISESINISHHLNSGTPKLRTRRKEKTFVIDKVIEEDGRIFLYSRLGKNLSPVVVRLVSFTEHSFSVCHKEEKKIKNKSISGIYFYSISLKNNNSD